MKYLFILLVFGVVAIFIYWRLRPYLKMARQMFGMVQDVRSMRGGNPHEIPRRQSAQQQQSATEKLVRCQTCGTWLPASRAVTLRGSTNTYCSHDCLEQSANASTQATRKSAS